MSLLDDARRLNARASTRCDGPIHFDYVSGKGRCGYCYELIPTNQHLVHCPVLSLPKIAKVIEAAERLAKEAERAAAFEGECPWCHWEGRHRDGCELGALVAALKDEP